MTNNPIADYKKRNRLDLKGLADALRISKGHACDLVNGKERVGRKVAARMAELTGKPWHKFISAPTSGAPAE